MTGLIALPQGPTEVTVEEMMKDPSGWFDFLALRQRGLLGILLKLVRRKGTKPDHLSDSWRKLPHYFYWEGFREQCTGGAKCKCSDPVLVIEANRNLR